MVGQVLMDDDDDAARFHHDMQIGWFYPDYSAISMPDFLLDQYQTVYSSSTSCPVSNLYTSGNDTGHV